MVSVNDDGSGVCYLAVDAEHVQCGGPGVGVRQQLFDLQQHALIQRTVVVWQHERAELIQTET